MLKQVIETGSANTLQFVTAFKLHGNGVLVFNKNSTKINSILARLLLKIEGIEAVEIASDSIMVTKSSDASWEGLRSFVSDIISSYLKGDFAVLEGDCADSTEDPQQEEGSAMLNISSNDCTIGCNQDDDEVVRQIKNLLETKIGPALRSHGGSVVFCDFKDGIVFLSMQGACTGCPGAVYTLKNGIESLLKYHVPEVIEVQAV